MADEHVSRDAHSHIRIKADRDPATVKIVSEDTDSGYVIINESDFDKKVHKKFVEKSSE